MLQMIARLIVTRRNHVQIGSGSKVNWFQLLSTKRGVLTIGQQCSLAAKLSFDQPNASICIGNRSYIGKSHLVAASSICLGDDVIISWGVTIVDHNSHALDWQHRADDVKNWLNGNKDWTHVNIQPVVLGNRVWVGFNASILKGVSIGEGAVIGANSVVTKDIPPYCVAAGNPARVIRMIEPAHD